MARPTKLVPEILEKTKEYIRFCLGITKEDTKEIGEIKVKIIKLPTIEGLAVDLNLNKTTIYAWRKEKGELNEEFSNLIDQMLNIQADLLINKGLLNEYNSTIAKVLLTKHGYREGIESDLTSKGEKIGSTILPEVIAEADRLLKERKLHG